MCVRGTEEEYLLPKQQKAHGHVQEGERSEDYEECIALFLLYYLPVPSV